LVPKWRLGGFHLFFWWGRKKNTGKDILRSYCTPWRPHTAAITTGILFLSNQPGMTLSNHFNQGSSSQNWSWF
jgi:hypothetical protein